MAPWCLDSGGFTQLQRHGRWTITPADYIERVRRYRDEIGMLGWAAPQDEMCEPAIIHGGWHGGQHFVGTHRSVVQHQQATVRNYQVLRDLAPDLPIIPVIQGYTEAEYEHCCWLYEAAGVDLTTAPLVGLGSVCRRQDSVQINRIVTAIRAHGIGRLHGFGVKTLGLQRYGHLLTSADSQAWSFDLRRKRRPVCGQPHPRGAKNCANCLPAALAWRARLLHRLATTPRQLGLDEGPDAT